ncbi:hypothetical protein NWP17_12270, partial [Chrysosporum bergii ANA360D]
MEDSMILTEDLINNGDDNTTTNNDQMMDLLQQSPFAPLLEIDGVTPETLINSFATAFGDSDSSVDANLFADGGVLGTDPFADFGNPTAEGNPLTGGVNPWADLEIYFASTGGGVPSPGEDESSVDGGENTTTNNDETMDLLQQSPFAPLLEIDGITPESLINSFATGFGDSDSSVDTSLFADGGILDTDPFASFGDPMAEGNPLTGGVNPWAGIDIDSGSTGGGMGGADSSSGDSLTGGGMPSFGGGGFGSGDSSSGGMPSFGGGGFGSGDSSSGGMPSFGGGGFGSGDSSSGGMPSCGGGGFGGGD